MIELRPLNWANIEKHYEWNNDEELNYYDSDFPYEKESFESFKTRFKALHHPGNTKAGIFEIIHKENNELIGIVDFHSIDLINKRCFLEITIAVEKYRNKGYGKDALKKALYHCFNVMKLNKVSTSSFDFNASWINLVARVGFKQEGTLRQHVFKRGKYHDKLIYGLLAEEYANSTMYMEPAREAAYSQG